MALIKCKECNKDISDQAKSCPHCGAPNQNFIPTKNQEKEKKKYKGFKRFLFITLGLFIFGFIVLQFLPKDAKKQLYEEFGIENSDFIKENALSSYVEMQVGVSKNVWGNKWVISGKMWSTHPSAVIHKIKVRFDFSDGSETEIFNKTLNPDAIISNPILRKIPGHSNATYKGFEIIEAYE